MPSASIVPARRARSWLNAGRRIAILAIIATTAACGTKVTPNAALVAPVSVSVSPATVNVELGQTQAFSASVSNATNTAVSWQVNGIPGGNMTIGTVTPDGRYTAPGVAPSPATLTISAVSTADSTKSGAASVTIMAPVSVAVSPPAASMVVGTTQTFTATVSNTSNTAVTWLVNGIAGGDAVVGTITSGGVYTAPAGVPSPATLTVSAVSAADSTKSGTASVTIVAPVSVSVSPPTPSVMVGTTQQFTATVSNTSNTAVTWLVNGFVGGNPTVGTITSGGLYTAPAAVPSPATVTVSAVSAADSTKSGTASVTITLIVSVSVAVAPPTASVVVGATQQFTATVSNTSNTAVSWKVNGVAGGNATVGTITSGGLYTAPAAMPSPATVTVSAVSAADSTKSGTASVTITPPVSVTVSPPTRSLAPGATQQFTATVSNTSNTAVSWKVNGVAGGNATVGTITSGGLYTAPAAVPSPATVTVSAVSAADSTKSGTASVTITLPVSVSVSPPTASVMVGTTQTFTATVSNTSNTAVSWLVNGIAGGNATVGTITSGGLYTAPAAVPSPATVTVSAVSAADSTKSGTASVTITPLPVSVSVSPPTAGVPVGATQAFTATVSNTSNTAVSWQVNGIAGGNATVGTITSGGLYTAPAAVPSPATVTVSAVSAADSTKSGTASVTITPANSVSVTVTPPTASVVVGTTQTFTATVSNTSNTAVTWQVNGIAGGNATVGTITSGGLYTAPAAVPSPATVTISAVSAADTTKSGTASVTITLPVSVSVSPPTASVVVGTTQTFTATVSNTSNTAVSWKVNGIAGGNATVGTITSGGLYTAPVAVPSPATVTVSAVSAADSTKSGTASVTITLPVSVSVSPPTASVMAGTTQTFTATVSNTSNTAVSWKVNGIAGGNATVGTITSGGLYTAPAAVPSPATVTVSAVSAADSTKSGTASVTITPPVSVTVSPPTASVVVGSTQQFTATVSNTSNTAVSWLVNGIAGGNATVGTITSGGLYTAPGAVPSPATVTVSAVSAADSTKSGTASVTITPPVSVTVSPPTASVAVGSTQQFTATVSNTSNTAVTWQVNGIAGGNATVGTITSGGRYTAPAAVPSPATVTVSAVSAADSTKSGSATVTVTAASITVTLSPRNAALTTSQSQQFTATVTGTTNTAVTWTVDGISGGNSSVGTISTSGLYAPTTSAVGTPHTVTATSSANPAQSASGNVYVTNLAGIVTQRYDVARTGQNLQEYALTPTLLQTSGTFGKLFSCTVDDNVYAQPLYVANLSIAGGTHNVVFVATENDSVYAFDADASPCVQYWKTSFLSSGVTAVPAADTGDTDDLPGHIGITGAPVINLANNTLYVVPYTKESGPKYVYRLHALNLGTGAEQANSPQVIQASAGGVTFNSLAHMQRPGLLFTNNTVYIAFGSHGDYGTYYGWVMGYDPTTLAQTSAVNTAPNADKASIWMSGSGPAADSSGSIYVATANGAFNSATNDFGDTVLKLSPSLAISDYFTPSDQATLNADDWDLGSGGVLVLPDAVGSTAHPHLAVVGDKESKLYLFDRDNLGHYNSSSNANLQTVKVNSGSACITCGVFGTPSVWGSTLYVGTIGYSVKAFAFSGGLLGTSPSSQTSDTYQFPGGETAISANGATNGVLWALDTNSAGSTSDTSTNGPAVLRAYDATNLATRLWSSGTLSSDAAVNAVKFMVPTVANGKVYVAGQKQITVYGLKP